MLYSDEIKNAYKSLAQIDRKSIKTVICEKFGYKERNFQAKMSGYYTWTKAEIGLLRNLLELDNS